MSVILDALKKLERDKAACRKGPVDIVPEITVPRNHGSRPANWKIPAIIISFVVATAAATTVIVIALAHRGTRPVVAVSPDSEYVQPVQPSNPAREQAASKIIPDTGSGHLAAEAVKAPPAKRSIAQPVDNAQHRFPSHETRPPAEQADDAAISSGGASSDLKVSGIAWQDERADRRAVVNGALVGEGTVVEGARIVRIFQDRVRFSRSGGTFEINVSGSSQAK